MWDIITSGYSWFSVHLYWWVIPLIGGIALIATMPWWSPIWAVLPKWLKLSLGAIAAGLTIWQAGKNKGAADSDARREKADTRATQKREEVHEEIKKLDPAERDKRLDRWMRHDD
jgi:hypothetical protein